ncbi:MAG: fibronectin type III domain-containing protein, partial [Chloroflexi bacterium]|nr:fibronectin type III domain-containing protein [Chloroflexota bacterium]
MRNYLSVTTLAFVGALALTMLLGVLLPPDNVAHAEPPVFDTTIDPATREVPENTPPGVNIGPPVFATDPDETGDEAMEFGNTLTYSLGGTDAALFDIDASTGQLITKASLDAEAGTGTYSVTVTVDDGETRATPVAVDVTISVTNVAGTETPLAPVAPTVVSRPDDDGTDVDESTTSLKVVWHPPESMGRPAPASYEVEFKESTGTTFGEAGVTIDTFPTTTATITGLEADTSYDVRVRATNDDGEGLWSLVGTGSTNKENNSAPSFNEDDSLVTRDVDENTPAGENVDGPVTATDADTTT